MLATSEAVVHQHFKDAIVSADDASTVLLSATRATGSRSAAGSGDSVRSSLNTVL